MANSDSTSKPRRSRRNQSKSLTASVDTTPLTEADLPPPPEPPRTLEEAIENVRTTILQARGMIHCLADVLLHSDDEDAGMHAETAKVIEVWMKDAAAELDIARLQPLIDAIRQRGGGSPNEGESGMTGHAQYQVREPRPVYVV